MFSHKPTICVFIIGVTFLILAQVVLSCYPRTNCSKLQTDLPLGVLTHNKPKVITNMCKFFAKKTCFLFMILGDHIIKSIVLIYASNEQKTICISILPYYRLYIITVYRSYMKIQNNLKTQMCLAW